MKTRTCLIALCAFVLLANCDQADNTNLFVAKNLDETVAEWIAFHPEYAPINEAIIQAEETRTKERYSYDSAGTLRHYDLSYRCVNYSFKLAAYAGTYDSILFINLLYDTPDHGWMQSDAAYASGLF